MDKFKKLPISNKNDDSEFIRNIGLSLGIEPSVWNGMTHDKRLLTIYEQLPNEHTEEFKETFPQLFKPKFDYRILDNNGGKRNKSKKPKPRNSRSKRRKTVSKRRR
jgi:hypothetical protein